MDLVRRFCPHGHEMLIPGYVWHLFLFHRCRACKKLYQPHELEAVQPEEAT